MFEVHQRVATNIAMNDMQKIQSAAQPMSTSRSLQSRTTNAMPIENEMEVKSSINEFVVDDNKQDILIYEVEYKDPNYEKLQFNKYLIKNNFIHIPPLAVFLMFNISYILLMISLMCLLIALVGPISYSGYNETCSNTIECNSNLSLVCDYSTGLCDCDRTYGYTWTTKSCAKCPQSWTKVDSSCYLSSGLKTNYTFASDWCTLQNSKLVVFSSAAELTALENVYATVFTPSVNNYYIGCSDLSASQITCLDTNTSPISGGWCTGASTGTVGKRCVIVKLQSSKLCFDIIDCNTISTSYSFMCKIAL